MRRSTRSASIRIAALTAVSAVAVCTFPAAATAGPRPSNLARTRAELHRLEGAVRLPASSYRRAPVHRLTRPADLPAAGRSLKDLTQYYRVHLGLKRVLP